MSQTTQTRLERRLRESLANFAKDEPKDLSACRAAICDLATILAEETTGRTPLDEWMEGPPENRTLASGDLAGILTLEPPCRPPETGSYIRLLLPIPDDRSVLYKVGRTTWTPDATTIDLLAVFPGTRRLDLEELVR